jgi:hypothetical protein
MSNSDQTNFLNVTGHVTKNLRNSLAKWKQNKIIPTALPTTISSTLIND